MQLTPERIEALATERSGQITASTEDGRTFRVEFPISTKAASFYDLMVDRLRSRQGVSFQDANRCIVVVTLPEED